MYTRKNATWNLSSKLGLVHLFHWNCAIYAIVFLIKTEHDASSNIDGSGNVEDMLLSMLDERDRLMVGLKDAREELLVTQTHLKNVERERDSLCLQVSCTIPQVSYYFVFIEYQ